jgi:uncharacterized protein (DUF302 family)
MDKTEQYAMVRTTSLPFEEADQRVRAELAKEGFGVLTEIDVTATLKAKLDVDVPRTKILGACMPRLAYQAMQAEPDVALLLPCNVVVRDTGRETVVEAIDPVVQLGVSGNQALLPVAQDVRARLERVLDTFEGDGIAG